MRLPSRRDGILGGRADQQVRERFASADMDHRSFVVRRGRGSRAGEDAVADEQVIEPRPLPGPGPATAR